MRILIVSASAGAGHTRAGQALEDAFARLDPVATVRHVDILDFTAKAYKKAYAGGFLSGSVSGYVQTHEGQHQ